MPRHTRTIGHGLCAILCIVCPCVMAAPASAVVTERLKLLPEDGVAGDDFGEAVAVNGNGLALVGAPKSGPGGAAYVFDANTGQQLFRLVPDDQTTGSFFGASLAVYGNLALIGAPGQGSTGAVYLFDLTTGIQAGKLVADDAATAPGGFGNSVAINNGTAVIGAWWSSAAYLFDVSSNNQIAKLTNDSVGHFGEAVDIRDGIAVVGATMSAFLYDSSTGLELGHVSSDTQTQFGLAVAVSGGRTLVGSPDNSYDSLGSAHLYDISDLNDIALTTSVYYNQPGVRAFFFGSAVELQGDLMLASTWFADDGGPAASGVIYQFDPLTGVLIETFRSSDPAYDDQFGISMDLAGDTLIVGAVGFEDTNDGAAYLFTIPEPSALALFAAGLGLLCRGRRM